MQLIAFKVEVISGVEAKKIQVKSGEKVSTETCLNTKKQHYHDGRYCFSVLVQPNMNENRRLTY